MTIEHPTTAYSSSTDEISLLELWDALVRQWKWVLGIWLLVLALAGMWLALAEPVYESRAVLRIGQVAGKPLQPLNVLVLALREQYQLEDRDRPRPRLLQVKEEGSEALVLTGEAHSAKQARALLTEVLEQVMARQQQRYQQQTNQKQQVLAVLQQDIEQRMEQGQRLTQAATSADLEESIKALLVLQASAQQADVATLHERLAQLEDELSPRNTYPAEILREPTLAERPSSPKTALVLALATMLGGMAGVMTGLMVEFVRGARQAGQRQQGSTPSP